MLTNHIYIVPQSDMSRCF